ncbi:MAG: Ig-like domain-containing protein [Prevotella sp.]|nr:Ig-like domain-containing protein [Prevotella sp.]
MKKYKYLWLCLLAMTMFSACGDDDDKGQAYGYDPTRFTGEAPQVVSTFPEADAVDVDTLKQIVITYDKNIFVPPHATIRINGVYIDDTDVTAQGNQLIIPYELKGNTTYTVEVQKPTVRNEVYDFASDYKFSFSTMIVNTFDPTLFNLAEAPVNPDATPETVALYNYLKENFGKKTLTAASAEVNWNTKYADQMYEITGKYPAINMFDYIHFNFSKPKNPSNWIDYTNTTVVENWTNAGGIVSIMWHWMVPPSSDKVGNYDSYVIHPDATDFDPRYAWKKSSGANAWQYEQAVNDIDIIASYLLQLQEKGIPVLWRPLHEARGNYGKYGGSGKAWFWWGKSGPQYFTRLWKMMYDRFKEKGVNNVLWVWTSEGLDPNDPSSGDDSAWYPGDDYVDIISRDYYFKGNSAEYHSALSEQFEALRYLTGGKKIIAFSEGDAMPGWKNMLSDGAMWSWAMPWYGADENGVPYIGGAYNNEEFLKDWMNSPVCITRDQVPSFK